MPRKHAPSIRSIARATGLSKATVAYALNGTPGVAEETVRKVREAADKAGYRRNPMFSALMSAMRRAQGVSFQGVLAAVDLVEPDRPAHGPFHRELVAGARATAETLGFSFELHQVGGDGMSPERLSSVLRARGIRGLVILPSWRTPDFSRFDWAWFTGIYADYIAEKPVINAVCSDHYRSMLDLLNLLHARGYRRPGLVIEEGRDERVHLRTGAALRSFNASRPGAKAPAPFVIQADKPGQASGDATPAGSISCSRRAILDWARRERIDVLLSHHPEILDWLGEEGLAVPGDLGFVGLNLAKTKGRCAGLDLRPRLIGSCAVETLVGQIQRQAWGLPEYPTTTTLAGEFRDGPTLRTPQ